MQPCGCVCVGGMLDPGVDVAVTTEVNGVLTGGRTRASRMYMSGV